MRFNQHEESLLIFCTLVTAVEFGFQPTNYSVSEEPRLRDVSVCVTVNNGTLERDIEITFNVIDITAESTLNLIFFSCKVCYTLSSFGIIASM